MGTPEGHSTFPLLSAAPLAFVQCPAIQMEVNVGAEIGLLS